MHPIYIKLPSIHPKAYTGEIKNKVLLLGEVRDVSLMTNEFSE